MTESAACCRHKAQPRNDEFRKDIDRRINRAVGQLNGIKAMIDDNRYCGDVLTQLAAVESAVRRIASIIMRDHLKTCVIDEIKAGNEEVIDEVMDLFHQFG